MTPAGGGADDVTALGTRTVIAPDRSIFMAGPLSRYNADPTQIPVNPLPPIRPPGYQTYQAAPAPTPR